MTITLTVEEIRAYEKNWEELFSAMREAGISLARKCHDEAACAAWIDLGTKLKAIPKLIPPI